MKAIKRFNNNIVLCITNKGKEVVAFGKGLGFHEIPYEVELSKIERTFYSVKDEYLKMINDIPEDVIKISSDVIDFAREQLNYPFNGNIVFTLADHITFAIKRYQDHINFKLPIIYDINYLFEKELEVGKYALQLIKKKYHIHLPQEEATYIALHLINAKEQMDIEKENIDEKIIQQIINIIENEYCITINKNHFNYSRFISHMYYLLKRSKQKHLLSSDNHILYDKTKEEFPKTYNCTKQITQYLLNQFKIDLTDEEELYLMLHINRLCTREECYQ